MTERYADVILNISHESVDRPFTYIIPEGLRGTLTPGTAVQVPFGNAKEAKLGYVLSLRKEAVWKRGCCHLRCGCTSTTVVC